MLRVLIQALMDLLDTPIEQLVPISAAQTLDSEASNLTVRYDLTGIRSDLTSQETLDGLADCSDAMGILNDPNAELDISEAYRLSLMQTIQSMEGDLDNAL